MIISVKNIRLVFNYQSQLLVIINLMIRVILVDHSQQHLKHAYREYEGGFVAAFMLGMMII